MLQLAAFAMTDFVPLYGCTLGAEIDTLQQCVNRRDAVVATIPIYPKGIELPSSFQLPYDQFVHCCSAADSFD